MISIAGTQVNPNTLPWNWSQTDSARRILSQMAANRTVYSYSRPEELEFEIRLRTSIMNEAIAMEQSNVSFADFEHSRCNPVFWILSHQGGFQLRPNVSPSAAIRDIYWNGHLYSFECATAMIILYYKAVLEVIGDRLFDQLFGHLYLYSWEYDRDLAVRTIRTNEFLPADVLYFINPDVDPMKPEWQGVNVVNFGNGYYFGHGIGIRDSAGIILSLNRHRRPGATRNAYLLNQATNPGYSYLYRVSSGMTSPLPIIARIGMNSYRIFD
ncbi:protein-glutamine gamma-glutamyltransferase [Paenibacillus sp. J2TS4]|uniref:protein-glutamine gamma-glutamyltransferase n=1 Tax=Paenibacillus sp. J2TS4 TaxID=2807194 RepID=UPI001B2E4EA5|nr:protein-glutamine gamma-glutamyltransferase [Paenibacillus sp. J2TS4]GIP33161.1 protein-glutamine gamma-glutamyltransferase [Paenibacillus sp. J2TS4]